MIDNKQILLVDDEIAYLSQVSEFLWKQYPDVNILTTVSPEKAIEIATKNNLDLIITDWEMPKISGPELIRMLKSMDETKGIPIILITGKRTESDDLRMALARGAQDFIRKPLDFVELEARIKTILRLKEQHDQLMKFAEGEKLRIQEELDQKKRQLSSMAAQALEKENMLSAVSDTMLELKEELLELDSGGALVKKTKSLIKELVRYQEVDKSWEQYKYHFEEVHPAFFSQLKETCPTLTIKELKLAAYLKIGLQNKEISSLINVTYYAVKKSIYRMKKKLALRPEDDLRSFLADF